MAESINPVKEPYDPRAKNTQLKGSGNLPSEY